MNSLDWDWMYLTFQMIAESAQEQAKLPENEGFRRSLEAVSTNAWAARRFIADCIRNRKPEPQIEVEF